MGYTSNQRVLKMVYQFLLRKASIKKLGNNTMATTQTQSHLPTPITKPGLSYGKNVIATINNRWVHIQSKDFDGDTSIPTEKGLNKNWETIPKLGNNTMATTKTQSQIPTPITKPGLSYGKNVIATIKYH